MRIIKFRGKSKRTGEWLYGDLVRNVEGAFAIVPPFDMDVHNICSNYEVNKDTISQFTGLHDRNGKEIYESDILHFVEYGDELVASVKWNKGIGAWCLQLSFEPRLGCKPLGDWLLYGSLDIVGNVVDNPELLKGGEI